MLEQIDVKLQGRSKDISVTETEVSWKGLTNPTLVCGVAKALQ